MHQVDIYRVDPTTVARGHMVGYLAIGVTALVAALLVMRFGWRCWWVVILAAIAIPAVATFIAAGAHFPASWPLIEYFSDVVMPLALLGLPAVALGSLIGAAIRWVLARKAA